MISPTLFQFYLFVFVPKIKKIRGRENIAVGTWNVRTLRPAGKLEQLTHAMSRYHWNIVGLCEMRWKNFGEMSTDDGHKVYFSGEEGKHEYGMGFLVHKDVVGAVLGCQQTDINPPESSSFQYHHHTGLCTNIWSWWQWGRPLLPATPGNHRQNTKEGHSGCTRGLECQSWEGCTGRLGRSLWTVLQCRDKWERSQTSRVCNF